MKPTAPAVLTAAFLWLLCCSAARAGLQNSRLQEPGPVPGSPETVSLNLYDASLERVVEAIADLAGLSCVFGPRAGKKIRRSEIRLHMGSAIAHDRLLPLLHTILEVSGFSLIECGEIHKIVRSRNARRQSCEVHVGKSCDTAVRASDRRIIQIIPLEYLPVRDAYKVLRRFKSRYGRIRYYKKRNMLTVFDTAGIVRKMLSMLRVMDVDVFQSSRVAFFKIEHAPVKDMTRDLQRIVRALDMRSKRGRQPGIALVPLERISTLAVVSSVPGGIEEVSRWIERLDQRTGETEQQIFIYKVSFGRAEAIAGMLNSLYRGSIAGRPARASKRRSPILQSQGRYDLTVDERTNSIIVRAAPLVYAELKKSIERIDVFPRQVLIEVLVAEVSLSGDTELGIEWALLGDAAGIGGYTGTDHAGVDYENLSDDGSSGFVYRFDSDRLQAFLRAQASRNKLSLLSAPRIMAADGSQARIEIGNEVPIVTSEYVPPEKETDTATSRSIEYRSTGILLYVEPRIAANGFVTLEIRQELSEAQALTSGGVQSPVISSRKTRGAISVQDGETVVLGGMIGQQKNKTKTGIPVLSSIPLLGAAFSSTTDSSAKTELVILITPHVVRSVQEASDITSDIRARLSLLQRERLSRD